MLALLDPERMADLFSRLPALRRRRVIGAEVASLWVKPGRHFHAAYRLSLASRREPLVASALVLQKAPPAPVSVTARRRTSFTSPGLMLQLFPSDHRLPTLEDCLHPVRLGGTLGAQVRSCAVASYRPGRRCQIRYSTGEGELYGKVAVEAEPGSTFALHRRIHAELSRIADDIGVPEPVERVAPLHLSLVRAAPGRSLYDALRQGEELGGTIRRLGRQTARFHGLETGGRERVHGPYEETALVRSWTELTSALFPKLAPLLSAAMTSLAAAAPAVREPRAFVHRDFYDKQIILAGEGFTLLDLDTACRGDPEIDAANFCAHLHLRSIQTGGRVPARSLEEDFLSG